MLRFAIQHCGVICSQLYFTKHVYSYIGRYVIYSIYRIGLIHLRWTICICRLSWRRPSKMWAIVPNLTQKEKSTQAQTFFGSEYLADYLIFFWHRHRTQPIQPNLSRHPSLQSKPSKPSHSSQPIRPSNQISLALLAQPYRRFEPTTPAQLRQSSQLSPLTAVMTKLFQLVFHLCWRRFAWEVKQAWIRWLCNKHMIQLFIGSVQEQIHKHVFADWDPFEIG